MFDEFEKAHKDVWNLLLQVFDEGFLTDSQGRKVDFRSTIIIMTSNLGSEVISSLPENLLGSEPEPAEKILNVVRQTLSPELLNRIDDVVIFNRLQREHMRDIVDIQLKRVSKLAMDGPRLTLSVNDDAKDLLANMGYDVRYGARPLARTIQKTILAPLSRLLLDGGVLEGETATVSISTDGESIVVERNHDVQLNPSEIAN